MPNENEITLHVTDREGQEHELIAPTDFNLSLMEVCKMYELPIAATCGGMAMCSTCHVYILSDEHVEPRNENEEITLFEMAFNIDEERSRLACQIHIAEKHNNMRLKLAPQAN